MSAHASQKPVIVLVHGAFADHHAFDAVRPLLEQRGWNVLTPDLPGHGDDATPVSEITLDLYVDAIARVVESQPAGVVLAGHSMAGMVVSQVAERLPQHLRAVLYMAAYLPQDGQSLQQLAQGDGESLVGQNMEFAADYSTVSIKSAAVGEAIAGDLPLEVQAYIASSQRPEPLAPFQGAVHLSAANFGAVPKGYLSTTLDRAVTPALQKQMLAATPVVKVEHIATSHLPFVAKPQECVEKLLALLEAAAPVSSR
jgi:pimeloyl-ACP methyl ester carboxylesterase